MARFNPFTKKAALLMLLVLLLLAVSLGIFAAWPLTLPATPAAPLTPSAAPAAPAPTRTRQDAMKALMALPELSAWSAHLEKTSNGKVRGALIEYDPAFKIVDGKSYWQLSFVENGSDAAHPWESFLVASNGDEILVDPADGAPPITLAQWRQQSRPMERTSLD